MKNYKLIIGLFESKEREFKKYIAIDAQNKKCELNQFFINESIEDNSNEILDLFGKEFKIIDYFLSRIK